MKSLSGLAIIAWCLTATSSFGQIYTPPTLPDNSTDTPYSLTLGWNASNPSNGVAGYKLYYGNNSGQYTSNVNAGNALLQTVSGLSVNIIYYFAATAYGSQGQESGYSNEVAFVKPTQTVSIGGGGLVSVFRPSLLNSQLPSLSEIEPPVAVIDGSSSAHNGLYEMVFTVPLSGPYVIQASQDFKVWQDVSVPIYSSANNGETLVNAYISISKGIQMIFFRAKLTSGSD